MKKYLMYIRRVVVFLVMIAMGVMSVQFVYGRAPEPGSEQDPIITRSYLEDVVAPQIYNYLHENIEGLTKRIDELMNRTQAVEESIEALKQNPQAPSQGESERFTVVQVEAGQKLIGGEGTELILRMGRATIIATEMGGLADTTHGQDLQNGTAMPPNHMLIIPRADGRGFEAHETVLVMVKGPYVIE